jgi:glycosyltransferase involved in cell wall biosynthesis
MVWKEQCAVVIPCLNEGATIAGLVSEVRQTLPSVIVVDDGSTDDTSSQAAAAGAQVISHGANRGKGAAFKTGAAADLKGGRDWVVTMDGDGQHKPEDLPAFMECAERTGAKLVIGDRMHNAQVIPWLRRQVNRWMSRRISMRAGRVLADSQCGFRLVDLRAWSSLRLETDHFEFESEMLLAFVRAGHRVEFVPISVVAKGLRSHIRPLRDTCRWLRWWRRTA